MNFQTTIKMTLSEKQLKRLGHNIQKTYLERVLLNHGEETFNHISRNQLFDMVFQRLSPIPIEDLGNYVKNTLKERRRAVSHSKRYFMEFWSAIESMSENVLFSNNPKYNEALARNLFNRMSFYSDNDIRGKLHGEINSILRRYFPISRSSCEPSVFDIVEAKAQKKAVDIIKSKWLEIYYSPRHPVGIKRFERELDKLGLE
jgi:hypothetical protein